MKKFGIIVGILVVIGMWIAGAYNTLVKLDEEVKLAWANVETQYQRRADLVNQVVGVVQGSADFEKSTLTEVVEARAKATSTDVNINNPESIAAFQQAQSGLGGALSRLLVTVEAYPDIKTTEAFLTLQAQIEGTENRISVARSDYNAAVKAYNLHVRKFPTNLYAGMFGFNKAIQFESEPGNDVAPEVNFNFNK